MITHDLFFIHETKPNHLIELLAEIEYNVGIFKKDDSIKIVGEISDTEGNVYEIKDSIILNEFYWKFKDEIEEERKAEYHFEFKSKLKDF